jgi:TPR repeat protein
MEKTKTDYVRLEREVLEIMEIEGRLQDEGATREDIDRIEAIADAGSPRAEFDIGMCIYCGIQREADKETAFRWFERSRKHANSEIQFQLCYVYFTNGMKEEADDCVRRMVEDDPEYAMSMLKKIDRGWPVGDAMPDSLHL